MTDRPASVTEAPAQPEGWRGILDENERILWQGRPDHGFHVALVTLPLAVFGLAFAGFALFWMLMAAQAGGVFWMFGLIHFSVGAAMVFGALVWPTLRHRRTWYTLTDRRAFIATDLPVKGKRLESYPIGGGTPLVLKAGAPGSVTFFREERRGSKGRVRMVDIGFERIAEAEKVHGLIRGIQADAAARA